MSAPALLTFRTSTADDAPFLYGLIEAAMRPYVEATWGRWDEVRVQGEARAMAVATDTRIVRCDDHDAGVCNVTAHKQHLELMQLYLLPAFQSRGIGSQLLQQLISRSESASLPLRLRVLHANPARRLYERFGFTETERSAVGATMERPCTR